MTPRVSEDNAHVESLSRTAKYRPEFPTHGFATLKDARQWGRDFVQSYNAEHRHSGIRYVTPAQRQALEDRVILQARQNATEAPPLRTQSVMRLSIATLKIQSSWLHESGGYY